MLAIVAAAVRRRLAQSVTLFLLAAVASGGVAAAPGYAVASAQALAVASVADARGAERMVSVSASLAGRPDLGRAFRDFSGTVRRELVLAGARQRAALAMGIAAGPGLLLVDEPTSQLDSDGRDEVVRALERSTPNAGRRSWW